MALDEHIRSTVDPALAELTRGVEEEVRRLLEQALSVASVEREKAVEQARATTLDEAAESASAQVAAVEARLKSAFDAALTQAKDEAQRAAAKAREAEQAEAERKLQDAQAAASAHEVAALKEATSQSAQTLTEAVAATRLAEQGAELAALARLLESLRGLDGASSLSEVLDVLGQAAAREAPRAGVLVMRQERLIGWKLSGFGAHDAQPKTVDLGLTEGGVIALALSAARPASTGDGDHTAPGPDFAQLPAGRIGVAVPVIVGRRVVAVVYADSVTTDGDRGQLRHGWPEVIEILARHAARCLEALTVQKSATVRGPSPNSSPSRQTVPDD